MKRGVDAGDYVYLYDANGNVGQLVAWAEDYGGTTEYAWDTQQSPNVRLVAAYEYDPYGNITAQSGAYAGNNPFRFSTKYYDTQTGLGYWGYRHISPGLGRWISRDPIGERGDTNLYAFVQSSASNRRDALGLCDVPASPSGFHPPWGPPGSAGEFIPPVITLPPRPGCCGPDVTAKLNEYLTAVERAIAGAGEVGQCNTCYRIIGGNVNVSGPGNISCRRQWTRVGWGEICAVDDSCSVWGCPQSRCCEPYTDRLWGHIGNIPISTE